MTHETQLSNVTTLDTKRPHVTTHHIYNIIPHKDTQYTIYHRPPRPVDNHIDSSSYIHLSRGKSQRTLPLFAYIHRRCWHYSLDLTVSTSPHVSLTSPHICVTCGVSIVVSIYRSPDTTDSWVRSTDRPVTGTAPNFQTLTQLAARWWWVLCALTRLSTK